MPPIFADNSVNKRMLTQFLSDCRRIYENDASSSGLIMVASSEDDDGSINFTSEIYTALTDPIYMALGTVNQFSSDLKLITTIDSEEVTYRFGLTENSTDFVPICNLGITAQNPEEAVSFLKTALSYEVQKIDPEQLLQSI